MKGSMVMSIRFVAVCQWCGKRGGTSYSSTGRMPAGRPYIAGKCPGHPSGNPNAPHNPRWEEG